MVTYNVKTAAAMIYISQSWVIKNCKILDIKKSRGQYQISESDLETLKAIRNGKMPKRRIKARELRIPEKRLKYILDRYKINSEHPKVPELVTLVLSKHHTTKGIKHILGL